LDVIFAFGANTMGKFSNTKMRCSPISEKGVWHALQSASRQPIKANEEDFMGSSLRHWQDQVNGTLTIQKDNYVNRPRFQ